MQQQQVMGPGNEEDKIHQSDGHHGKDVGSFHLCPIHCELKPIYFSASHL